MTSTTAAALPPSIITPESKHFDLAKFRADLPEHVATVTKVAVVVIVNVGAALATYYNPAAYLMIAVVALPSALASLHFAALSCKDKETLAKMILIGALILSPIVTAGVTTLGFTLIHRTAVFFLSTDLQWGLLTSTLGLGVLGFAGPSCRELMTGTYALLSHEGRSLRAERYIRLVESSAEGRGFSNPLIEKIQTVWESVFVSFHLINPDVFQELPYIYSLNLENVIFKAAQLGSMPACSRILDHLQERAKFIEDLIVVTGLPDLTVEKHGYIQTKITETVTNFSNDLHLIEKMKIPVDQERLVEILARLDHSVLPRLQLPPQLLATLKEKYTLDAQAIDNSTLNEGFTELFNEITPLTDKSSLDHIITRFQAFKEETRELTKNAGIWKNLSLIPALAQFVTLTEQAREQINLWNKIAMGVPDKDHDVTTLYKEIQQKKSTLIEENDQDDQPTAMEGLYHFIQNATDFQELCEWLHLDKTDTSGIPDALARIGLVEGIDIEEKVGIKDDTKAVDAKNLLKKYIAKAPAPVKDIRSTVYEWLSSGNPIVNLREREWTKLSYRVLSGALLITPLFILPRLSMACVVLGVAHRALTRFTSYRKLAGKAYEYLMFHQVLNIADQVISRRNFLRLTSTSRTNMELFSRASLFGRLRIAAMETGLSYVITALKIGRSPLRFPAGIPGQGFMLGQELGAFAGEQLSHLRRRLFQGSLQAA